MVPNLVVGIEIYHFSLFEYNSRFAIIIAKGKWSIHGFKTVLKTGLNCDVVRNLVVEIAIHNFDLFHCALPDMSQTNLNGPSNVFKTFSRQTNAAEGACH